MKNFLYAIMLSYVATLLGDEYFSGDRSLFPDGWSKYIQVSAASGLTDDFSFESSKQVMRLGMAEDGKAGCMRSQPQPFPANGESIDLSFWLRSENGPATARILVVGTKYKWHVAKEFEVDGTWRKYSITAVPPAIPEDSGFWRRIDVKKGVLLIGKTDLKFLSRNLDSVGKNLLVNPDFFQGSSGWSAYHGGFSSPERLETLSRMQEPRLNAEGAMRLSEGTCITSFTFPVQEGMPYTASLWLKKADATAKASCRAYLLATNWQVAARHDIELSNEWKRYDFSGIAPKTPRNSLYLRIDVKDGAVLLQKAQVSAGEKPSDFYVSEKRAALRGQTLISSSDSNAVLQLHSTCTGEMVVQNIFGATVRKESFKAGTSVVKVNPDGKRGLFTAEFVSDGKKIGESRYVIMDDLSKAELPDNPLAGHVVPFLLYPSDEAHYAKYLPFENTFNRFFLQVNKAGRQSQIFKNTLKASKYRNIIVFAEGGDYCFPQELKTKIVEAASMTPELAEEYSEWLKQIIMELKGLVAGVELFNEPNLWTMKDGPRKGEKTMSPEKVAKFYEIARPIIKTIASEMLLVGPCICTANMNYAERFLKAGGGKQIDVFSFHNYTHNPDLTDTFGSVVRFHELLKQYTGKDLPVWNTEQFFGVQMPELDDQDSDYLANSSLPTEFEHATAMAVNLIHHAAAGTKFAAFTPQHFWRGFMNEKFAFAAAPASNVAVGFLGSVGTGEPLQLGEALKCFVFPKGQLATIHTISAETFGEMQLPGKAKAFDMMGNPLPEGKVKLSRAPVYLRFPASMSKNAIVTAISSTAFFNLGEPFSIRPVLGGLDKLNVIVVNRTNQKADLKLSLLDIPSRWSFEQSVSSLALGPGEKRVAVFTMKESDIKPLGDYRFKIGLDSGNERSSLHAQLAPPLFARECKGFDQWRNSDWVELGGENLSPDFHISERWQGVEDISARFACGWNADGLALSVITRDDKECLPDNAPGAWQDDSLQIYFDMRFDATAEASAKKRNLDDDLEYVISWVKGTEPTAYLFKACAKRYIGEANQETGVDKAVKVNCARLPDGLRYDIFLPAECLPDVKFKAGETFGFSMLVNDNDGKGRKTGLTLTPKGTQPFQHPERYCSIALTSE